jgi:hypothetical protein
MTSYKVHRPGVAHARKLIKEGTFDTETPWSEAAASTKEENEFLDEDGLRAYGEWHLAVDEDASQGTKGRYRFPYGDFQKVNRAALIHAKQRAAQNDHGEVEKAAADLLEELDRASSR